MRLKGHIAYRLLTDSAITTAILNQSCPDEVKLLKDIDMTRYTVQGQDNKFKNAEKKWRWIYNLAAIPEAIPSLPHTAYLITNTVTDKLDFLKIHKGKSGYDWTIFKDIPEGKKTFIFQKDSLLRFTVVGQLISFLYMRNYSKPSMSIVWVDRVTNEKHEAFENELLTTIDEITLYKLLCFFYFAENEEKIVEPGKKHGTKKQTDSLYNEVTVPVTIINNNWNVTSIRTEGFDVSGHFRMQPHGPGMKDTKMIFIQPFRKDGYVRKASKPDII